MATNHLDIKDRIVVGKNHELEIIKLLNKHRPVISHTVYNKWVAASMVEDMQLKVDAWATSGTNSTRHSAQIKYRETGGDLGVALIRPWEGDFNAFKRGYLNGQVNWDRDFINPVDFYVCLMGDTLCVIEGSKVKKICDMMLDKFVDFGGFRERNLFYWPSYKGAELRLVTDRGNGYSEGQQKIICYITPELIRMAGGYVQKA